MLRIAGRSYSQIYGTPYSILPLSIKTLHDSRWLLQSGGPIQQLYSSPSGRFQSKCLFSHQRPFTDTAAVPGVFKSGESFEPANDTVYALSTGAGVKAGIAIVRISGPECISIYNALCPSKPVPRPRYATVRTLYDPTDSKIILDSSALIFHFPAPKTVTGEDVLELHIHGGPATVRAVLSAILKCAANTRMAEPGEFTRRAFENGRLNLAQVEALSDTLAAETEQQRRAAVRGNSPKFGRIYDDWREELLYARGELEALIDFSEDQHFDESPMDLLNSVSKQVQSITDAITRHEYASHRGDMLRRGIEIALIGPPNAGKSSLLNLIVGRQASIVDAHAGTTRDIVEARYDIGGYLCTFADTAGLRERPSDANAPGIGEVEREGIERAKARASDADLIVVLAYVLDSRSTTAEPAWNIQYNASSLSDIPRTEAGETKPILIVVNKADIIPSDALDHLLTTFKQDIQKNMLIQDRALPPITTISCLHAAKSSPNHGQDPGNINKLTRRIEETIKAMTSLPPDKSDLVAVTERQRQLLTKCKTYLLEFITEAKSDADIVIAAEHLRGAGDCLARITGRGMTGDVEEVLGVVFEKFCVGK